MAESTNMSAAAKAFFASPRFVVAGASSDPRKFGNKIFAWYIRRSLDATPLNPNASSVTLGSTSYNTVGSISELPKASDTSLSIITPPKVTAKLLKEAKEAGIKAVWLQPGTFDDKILAYAKEAFPGHAVGGTEDGGGLANGGEGWCILVHGDDGLRAVERKERL